MTAQVKARAISCPNCGGTVQLRGFAHTLSAVCGNCKSVLDTSDPNVARVQQAQAAQPVNLHLPLGERCKFEGVDWQIIGFQIRTIRVEGIDYDWHEYVLFHPFKGFRYLTFYQDHWNLVRPMQALPEETMTGAKQDGRSFRLFQSAAAVTRYVLGEFPWRVTVGEQVAVYDYVSAPLALSKETTGDEVTWSSSRYVPTEEMKQAFAGRIQFQEGIGVYSNQPNPWSGKPGKMWMLFGIFLIASIVGMILMGALHRNEKVFEYNSVFRPGTPGEESFVTDFFDIKGLGRRAVDVDIKGSVDQNWAAFAIAMINQDTSEGFDFGKTLSYYSGSDSDGRWTEGSTAASQTLQIPPGRYYLRVEPDREQEPGETKESFERPIPYQITVKQDVPVIWPFIVAILLLPIPPIWASVRYGSFESRRWAESDPGGINSGSDSSTSNGNEDDD